MRGARFVALYRRHFSDHHRERLFLASLTFFVTFGVTRVMTHAFRPPGHSFTGVWVGGIHVQHLVWGILLRLAVGYAWLARGGTTIDRSAVRTGRVLAVLYGVGAALTLDEFALWLNLKDVYWEREGRRSVDAAVLFGGLVSAGLWGGPFLRAVLRQLGRLYWRRKPDESGAREPGRATRRRS